VSRNTVSSFLSFGALVSLSRNCVADFKIIPSRYRGRDYVVLPRAQTEFLSGHKAHLEHREDTTRGDIVHLSKSSYSHDEEKLESPTKA
jgi:hypothetical protein